MTEGYCESETTGGELPEVNHQSETERDNNPVNSIRPKMDGELPELRRSPHRAQASEQLGPQEGRLDGVRLRLKKAVKPGGKERR